MKGRTREVDVVVAGAGPAGSSVAEALAAASFSVALLEEHAEVGLPDHCSGLVSPRTLACARLPEEGLVRARYARARVWGPGGHTLWLEADAVQALAVDRTAFDRALAARAAAAGADLWLGTRAERFERTGDGVRVLARQAGARQSGARQGGGEIAFTARLLVGADGACSRVARWMGAPRPPEVVPALKAELVFRNPALAPGSIEIFLGRDVAPGWFAWLIPLPDGTVRAGLGAARGWGPPGGYLAPFLARVRERFGPCRLLAGPRLAPLPLGPARGFVGERVLLVGAAAGQTKPTTGGGLYFGLRAARMAACVAAGALASGDCSRERLAAYERVWARAEGRELAFDRWLRRAFAAMPDGGLDAALWLFGRAPVQARLARLGDMDYPSWFLRPPAAGTPATGVAPAGAAPPGVAPAGVAPAPVDARAPASGTWGA